MAAVHGRRPRDRVHADRHHANPNKLGSDPDIELPVIAVSPEAAARHHGPVITWLRGHQGVLFFPILLLEGLSLHASSVRRMFARGRLERRWAEIAFLSIFDGFAPRPFSS